MGQTRRARIALLSTSDTDLLSARASGAEFVLANPSRPGHQTMAEAIEGCDLVVGRVLAPRRTCATASSGSVRPACRPWSWAGSSNPARS